MAAQRKRLEKIYAEDRVRICCLADDPDLILGYGFLDTNNKPFIYVKRHYRNQQENVEEKLKQSIIGEKQ